MSDSPYQTPQTVLEDQETARSPVPPAGKRFLGFKLHGLVTAFFCASAVWMEIAQLGRFYSYPVSCLRLVLVLGVVLFFFKRYSVGWMLCAIGSLALIMVQLRILRIAYGMMVYGEEPIHPSLLFSWILGMLLELSFPIHCGFVDMRHRFSRELWGNLRR